jgi:GTPase SAR1 family protein
LLSRLQGKPFAVDYAPTPEISMATINWTYKASDDKIRVELWDVVDTVLADETNLRQADDDDAPAGIAANQACCELRFCASYTYRCAGIGASASAFRGAAEKLDAEHVDVYKGAHAVVVMFDITKRPTWDYVRSTLMEVPAKLPVLLLGNFRDIAAKRAVSTEEIENFADTACRERVRHGDGRRVQAFECSLKDCFGLKVLYNYFNIPFLELKVAALQDILKSSKEELATVRHGLGS